MSTGRASVAVLWFRRDLRLADNPALVAALAAADVVVPLFVPDPRLLGPAGDNRRAYLGRCLASLSDSMGGRLVLRSGDPAAVVPALANEVHADEVFCAEDFGPYGRSRDNEVERALAAADRRLVRVGSPYAVPPDTLFTGGGTPFKVFTPFSRQWRAQGWDAPVPEPAGTTSRWAEGVASEPLSLSCTPITTASLPTAGEVAAHDRLDSVLAGPGEHYGTDRDRPDRPGTSRLSADLKWGTLHPRQVLARLDDSEGHRTFATELCWREFYADVLFHHPDSARRSLNPTMATMAVDEGPGADDAFAAWCAGRTGYPIVDAGMAQLLAEGWMHNRVRMIVASFLVKDLHIDWTRGARWFMEHLVDGDLASNQHGWQWVAGTGTDAAPYFRVFNPVAQGLRFDPDGDYVRRYVPALRDLSGPLAHEPWKAPAATLFDHNGPGGSDGYPSRIVDHGVEREEALRRYAAVRGRAESSQGW